MTVTWLEGIPEKRVGRNLYMPPLFKVHLSGGRKPFFIVQKRAEPLTNASNITILNTWNGSYYNHHEGGGGKNQWLTFSFNVGIGLQYPYWMMQFYGAWGAGSTAHGARGGTVLKGFKNGNLVREVGIGNGVWVDLCSDAYRDFLDPDEQDTVQLWCQAYGTGSSWWANNHTAGNVCRRIVPLDDIETLLYKL